MINPRSDGGNADVQEKKGGGVVLTPRICITPRFKIAKIEKKPYGGRYLVTKGLHYLCVEALPQNQVTSRPI